MSDLDIFTKLAAEMREFNSVNRKRAVQGTTNRPYYREGPANEVKRCLDRLIATRQTQVIMTDPDCNFNTHRNKFSQAVKYLTDHLDPDNVYKDIMLYVDVQHKERTKHTYLKFRTTPKVLECVPVPELSLDLEKWITSSPAANDIFERTGLNLSHDEVTTLNNITARLDPSFISVITTNSIAVAKIAL